MSGRSAPRKRDPAIIENPPLPPSNFDPVHVASDRDQLATYWLPEYPEPDEGPEMLLLWKEFFTPPTRFVPANSRSIRDFVTGQPTLSYEGLLYGSQNWSGAAVAPHSGGRFTRIGARWTIPHVQSGTSANPLGLDPHCSIWIGLDGQKLWSQAMPQAGSSQRVKQADGSAHYILWWQWWLRNGLSAPWDITGVEVRADDTVLLHIAVKNSLTVRIHVKNRTTGSFATVQVTGTVPMQGASAEWVLERPADPSQATASLPNGPLYPLPDYGEVRVDLCATKFDNKVFGCFTPLLFRMAEVVADQPHVAMISLPQVRFEQYRTVRFRYRK